MSSTSLCQAVQLHSCVLIFKVTLSPIEINIAFVFWVDDALQFC